MSEADAKRLKALERFLAKYPVIADLYQRQPKLQWILKGKRLSKDRCRRQIAELMDLISELASCDYGSLHSADDEIKT
jgi:hypothetical protein